MLYEFRRESVARSAFLADCAATATAGDATPVHLPFSKQVLQHWEDQSALTADDVNFETALGVFKVLALTTWTCPSAL